MYRAAAIALLAGALLSPVSQLAALLPAGALDVVLLGGGSAATAGLLWALLRKAIRAAGAAGWRVSITFSRVDLARLEADAAEGRAAKAKADAVVREAEARVARAEDRAAARAAQVETCQGHAETIAEERDALARRIAGVGE